jgi:squalene-hopene/tetraprenyl-beta-curcumene cyclase
LVALGVCGAPAGDAGERSAAVIQLNAPNESVRNEVRHAIAKGLEWLERNQNTNGCWSSAEYPAITALGLTAFQLRPGGRGLSSETAPVRRGYAFVLSCVQPDGGIYRKELPSYNTSISLVALVAKDLPEYKRIILNARKFVAGLQAPSGGSGANASSFEGGIGYGKADKNPDLSNTSLAIEAMALSKQYLESRYLRDRTPRDAEVAQMADLDWRAVVRFIQSCQNLPAYNSQPWVSGDAENKGGFIYAPGRSMAGETNLASGQVALRSYGSMSYAGLLSYIYAELKHDDLRVTAVRDWLSANFTVEENPGMGPQGLFYYYDMMAKALTAYGADSLETRDGRIIKWREALALKLINLQEPDGHWANTNGRWFEKDPALVTAYSAIALDLIYNGL